MHCTMENSQSLFLIGLVLLIDYSCFLPSSASFSNDTDQHALLAIKSQLTYPANGVLAGNWTIRTSFCDWIGVSCSKRRQRVTALDLSYMDLHGMISPHVGNLSFLVSLRLQNNSLYGFVPHEIGRLHRLRILALQDNQLQGSVPPTLHHCQKLKVINLRRNMLSGLVPKELGSLPMLQRLYLTANNLSGGIPTSLGNISTLHELFLDQNSLTEYGSAGKVSTRGDVYSYGIMLFEIIARKRPTDGMFTEELTLRKWINASLPDGILGVVDIGLLSTEEGREMNATKRIILSIMDIGLRCSEEVPEERMDIKDVLRKLIKIKSALEM